MKTKTRNVSCIVLLALAFGSSAQAESLSATEASLVRAVNDVRAAHLVQPLKLDLKLLRSARAHTTTMLRTDILAHGSFASRLSSSGARGPRFGENLAWGIGSRADARAIVQSWLASPGHRANLLRPGFTRIGLGARAGSFAGYPSATVVTADFAGS
jgi:uncharacterized protein YkwD